ncbi:PREDICTED: uridine diphosphate glucose pyrophosphatase-like isoform X2 [Nicrophorus vespilloides]|nr:PREDICTED: uridine diphosphate glucose pyrophosphatase-like isoform X2 [Nicrophorus vespilloides]
MENLTKASLTALKESKYVKPLTLSFEQNGTQRTWDFLEVHDSVAIIIYNVSNSKLVFVKQFRPPVYVMSIPASERTDNIDVKKYPAHLGFTLELCAGIVDKKLSLAEIASEEILEECGYKVHHNQLERVSSYRSGVGTTGSEQTLYYCEVTDEMKENKGGGVEDEIIDVIEMSVPEIREFMKKEHILSPPSFLYAMQWFLANKQV